MRVSPQRGLFEADHVYLDIAGEDTFCGILAWHRGDPFTNEVLGTLYYLDNGRASVPPSLLAPRGLPLALLLQAHDWVSPGVRREVRPESTFGSMHWGVCG